jgi:hypothetical protein
MSAVRTVLAVMVCPHTTAAPAAAGANSPTADSPVIPATAVASLRLLIPLPLIFEIIEGAVHQRATTFL